jgi:hypothetical protein
LEINTTIQLLYPQKRTGTHSTGDWMGRRVGVDSRKKTLPPPEFDTQTIQPVASHYTNYAIPATI